MNILQYQEISLIPTGTTYEYELAKYFNIDTNRQMEEVRKDLTKALEIKEYKLDKNTFNFNGKIWYVEKDILEANFEQWTQLDLILAEGDNLKNLHRLLAIYCRPMERSKYLKQKRISRYSLDKQEDISKELLGLPIEIAQTLLVFFYQVVIESLNYIKIAYLNQMNNQINQTIKIK